MENLQSTTERMNLFQKIQAVSNEVRNIEKNMTVGTGNYSYKAVQDIDVMLSVKDAETKFKILSIPVKQELVKSETIKVLKDKGGEGINYVDIIKMTVRIIDLDNPDSFIEIESFGRGLDSGDKGFGKASTYARKYALLNAYKIATGQDPDANKSTNTNAVPELPEVKVQVFNLLNNDARLMQNVLQNFNKGALDELSDAEINKTYEAFKLKKLL